MGAAQRSWIPGVPDPAIGDASERQRWERIAELSDVGAASKAEFDGVARKLALELSAYGEHLEDELAEATKETEQFEKTIVTLENRVSDRDAQLKVMSEFRDIIISLLQRAPHMKKGDIVRELSIALYPKAPVAVPAHMTRAKDRLDSVKSEER